MAPMACRITILQKRKDYNDSMRDEKWDITKAIAIYLVVLGHLLALFGVTSNIINFSHMPIFFFISEYFLNHSLTKYNFFEVIKKKQKRY